MTNGKKAGPHESFMIRMWAEPDGDQSVLRGAIENVRTGSRTYFNAADLPGVVLESAAGRLVETSAGESAR